jgi:hypothetical protein
MRDNDSYDMFDDNDDDRGRRNDWDDDDDYRRPRRRKNRPLRSSGLGIASLVLGLIAGAIEFVNLVVAGVLSQKHGGELDENSTEAMAVGLILFLGLFMALIGGVLGIIGLVQKNRAKGFSIAGLVINSLVGLGMLGIIVLGLLMG